MQQMKTEVMKSEYRQSWLTPDVQFTAQGSLDWTNKPRAQKRVEAPSSQLCLGKIVSIEVRTAHMTLTLLSIQEHRLSSGRLGVKQELMLRS